MSPSETVNFALDVKPTSAPVPPPDPFQSVDSAGNPIKIGDYVDIYFCKVVGLRADPDNRLNLLVVPGLNKIITNDPANALNGQLDGKAILISGYHCVAYTAKGGGATRSHGIDTALTQAAKDATIEPTSLPSNFLAPSLE